MKFSVRKGMNIESIEKFLYPVKRYHKEKLLNKMYDDWNELLHTKEWLSVVLELINENRAALDIYYTEKDNSIIGSMFVLLGSEQILEALKNIKCIQVSSDKIAQISCFHILKEYRGTGLGTKMLEEAFKDLKKQNIEEVYIKSSHNKALSLYGKIGSVVGNYIGISDHELYQRYGYIFKINL